MRVIGLLPSFMITIAITKASNDLSNKVVGQGYLDSKNLVLGIKVMLSSDFIAKATRCFHEGNTYQEGWEKNYDSHVARALYKENVDKTND